MGDNTSDDTKASSGIEISTFIEEESIINEDIDNESAKDITNIDSTSLDSDGKNISSVGDVDLSVEMEKNIDDISVVNDIGQDIDDKLPDSLDVNVSDEIASNDSVEDNSLSNKKEEIHWIDRSVNDSGESKQNFITNNIVDNNNVEDVILLTDNKKESIKKLEEVTEDAGMLGSDEEGHIEKQAEEKVEIIEESKYRLKPSDKIQIWEARRGDDLKDIVVKWCNKENIELIWKLSKEYTISKDIFINGTFKNAIDILFSNGINNAPEYSLEHDAGYRLIIGE